MAEQFDRIHAVDNVQVQEAVLIEIRQLRGPGPAGRRDARHRCRIRKPALPVLYLQDVFRDLPVGRIFQHLRHHRRPRRLHRRIIGPRLHVGGEQIQVPIVVDVAHAVTHGVLGRVFEGHTVVPAFAAPCPGAVCQQEVVARHDHRALPRGQSGKGQGLGATRQHAAVEAAVAIFVPIDPRVCLTLKTFPQQRLEFQIVGTGQQVQITVRIRIAPCHAVGDLRDARQNRP